MNKLNDILDIIQGNMLKDFKSNIVDTVGVKSVNDINCEVFIRIFNDLDSKIHYITKKHNLNTKDDQIKNSFIKELI